MIKFKKYRLVESIVECGCINCVATADDDLCRRLGSECGNGARSWAEIDQMPTDNTLKKLTTDFRTVEVFLNRIDNHLDQCRFPTVPMRGDHLIIDGNKYKVMYRVLEDGEYLPWVVVTDEV
jgi:hypothetical protein